MDQQNLNNLIHIFFGQKWSKHLDQQTNDSGSSYIVVMLWLFVQQEQECYKSKFKHLEKAQLKEI